MGTTTPASGAKLASDAAQPLVSIAIANYNSAPFIEDCLRSALAQTCGSLEILVIDDCSSDDSMARVAAMAAQDPRIRFERLSHNVGPGGARNRAFDLARGRWFAVLDSDDLMHPDRLRELIGKAEAVGADIIMDDLLVFDSDQPSHADRWLKGRRLTTSGWISQVDYMRETRIFKSRSNLGYLKPIIAVERMRAAGVRYDQAMRIGEDQDLIDKLLHAGLTIYLHPVLRYFYRKHASSISHRMSSNNMARVVEQEARLRDLLRDGPQDALRALDGRLSAIRSAEAFTDLITALKARDIPRAIAIAARRPQALPLLNMPLKAAVSRVLGRFKKPVVTSPAPKVTLVSRQRLVGATNGSSTYLLDIVSSLTKSGLEVHLVAPSPNILGRWPFMRMKPEMDVFASIQFRGVARFGALIVSRNPAVYWAAGLAVLAQVLGKLKLPSKWLGSAPAPYSIAEAWTADDELFVTRNTAHNSLAVIADYVFQTEGFYYAIQPAALRAVVMHDLFHARAEMFEATGEADSVSLLSRERELDLLGRAQAVIAIQQAEADFVAANVPGVEVLLTPVAAHAVAEPQPGEDLTLLFVGSNTAPNIVGLEWFLRDIWPGVRAAHPAAELKVAGGVGRSVSLRPAGVRFLGIVDDLDAEYATAGLVISPLTVGSGLKIKLVEGLAHGKAMVVTPVTMQGVEYLDRAVVVAATAEASITAINDLVADRAARADLARRGLDAALAHFSSQACHGPLLRWIRQPAPNTPAMGPATEPALIST